MSFSWGSSKDTKKGQMVQRRQFKNPYINFMMDFRLEMQNRNVAPKQVMKLAGQRWRKMSNDQKLPYIEAAQKARRYRKPMNRRSRPKTMKVQRKEPVNAPKVQDESRNSPERSSSSEETAETKSNTSMATTNVSSDENY